MTAPAYRLGRYFVAQCRRDLAIAVHDRGDWLNALLFYVIVIALFPLGVSPEPAKLAALAPGVLWIAALLATLLALEGLFRRDFDDGSLEQFVLGAQPLLLGVLAKLLAFWLVTGLPLALLAPLLGYTLYLPDGGRWPLLLGLLLGTPLLCLLGAVGAALTVGLRRGGVLLSLLVLPLMVPVLILGVMSVTFAVGHQPAQGPLVWLAALLVAGLTLLPSAVAVALKIGVE